MKKTKKLIMTLLAATMLATVTSVTAFAEEPIVSDDMETVTADIETLTDTVDADPTLLTTTLSEETANVTDTPTVTAGDVTAATNATKGSPDTGIADVAVIAAGIAIIAGGACIIVGKKNKD